MLQTLLEGPVDVESEDFPKAYEESESHVEELLNLEVSTSTRFRETIFQLLSLLTQLWQCLILQLAASLLPLLSLRQLPLQCGEQRLRGVGRRLRRWGLVMRRWRWVMRRWRWVV